MDHWAFGPHHLWSEPATGAIIRMWQPFNGLEVFNPMMYKTGASLPATVFELPLVCKATAKLGCINGTLPPPVEQLSAAFGV